MTVARTFEAPRRMSSARQALFPSRTVDAPATTGQARRKAGLANSALAYSFPPTAARGIPSGDRRWGLFCSFLMSGKSRRRRWVPRRSAAAEVSNERVAPPPRWRECPPRRTEPRIGCGTRYRSIVKPFRDTTTTKAAAAASPSQPAGSQTGARTKERLGAFGGIVAPSIVNAQFVVRVFPRRLLSVSRLNCPHSIGVDSDAIPRNNSLRGTEGGRPNLRKPERRNQERERELLFVLLAVDSLNRRDLVLSFLNILSVQARYVFLFPFRLLVRLGSRLCA